MAKLRRPWSFAVTNATVAAISDRLRKAKASRDWKLYTIEGRQNRLVRLERDIAVRPAGTVPAGGHRYGLFVSEYVRRMEHEDARGVGLLMPYYTGTP